MKMKFANNLHCRPLTQNLESRIVLFMKHGDRRINSRDFPIMQNFIHMVQRTRNGTITFSCFCGLIIYGIVISCGFY
jgi:hypothetical protein